MRPRSIKRMVVGAFLALVLVAGVGTTSASAQKRKGGNNRPSRIIVYRPYYPVWYRYYDPFWDPFYGPRRVVDPIAYEREKGYREGKDEGEEDAKKGRQANATGHKDYRKSDSITFREAFVQGYADGYREEIAEMREEARKRDRD